MQLIRLRCEIYKQLWLISPIMKKKNYPGRALEKQIPKLQAESLQFRNEKIGQPSSFRYDDNCLISLFSVHQQSSRSAFTDRLLMALLEE